MSQRFLVKAFTSCADAEEWLNSLPPDHHLRGIADTNAYLTVAVERIAPVPAPKTILPLLKGSGKIDTGDGEVQQ